MECPPAGMCLRWKSIEKKNRKVENQADHIIHDLLELKKILVVVQIDMRALGDL